jgi:alpha-mannosidase
LQHKTRWTPQKIAQRIALIETAVYQQSVPIQAFQYKTLSGPLENPPIGPDVDVSAWEVITPKSYWGTWTTDFVLRTQFQIPADWPSDKPVALSLPLGDSNDFSHPEALAYIDGHPYASADRHHQEIILSDQFRDNKPHVLALHGWTGGTSVTIDRSTKLYMRECNVVQIDPPTREFIYTAKMALEVTAQLDDNNTVKGLLFNALDDAFKAVDTRDPMGTSAFYDSVPAALEILKNGIAAAGAPMDVDVIGVGHAHIDVAWLWQLGQTVRKSGRSFSNVLRLMEQFPNYKFSQSQAQLYQYTEQYYPEVFAGIKQRVEEGRWEPMGGTWVEPDCNAIGAESLVRQFLLGRGYFQKHFGADSDTPVLWLPDTFGYSWALPQLIKQAGMKYFITHKMSWNQYNHMPYEFMWWQGLDGTKVLTHFLTTPDNGEYLPHATTYNGKVSAKEVFGTWKNFQQKEAYNELITAYGYGDGGGGPTREMLENIERLSNHPGAPRVRTGTVREFMERVETEIADQLPVWNGEFYLEYHRGTYTSQARNKRNNRKSEMLLHDAEFLAAYAELLTGHAYPREDIGKAWELICLNQFHDILPGSSIGPVYVDSTRDYQIIHELGKKVRDEALTALATALPATSAVLVANPTSFGGSRIGILPGALTTNTHLVTPNGQTVATQPVAGGVLVEVPDLAPYSVTGLSEAAGTVQAADSPLTVIQTNGLTVLENALIRVEINAAGDLTRIYDKEASREVLSAGAVGNALLAFEDRPMNYDAWDIDIFYEDRTEKVEGVELLKVVEAGPLRVAVEITRSYRKSKIKQTIYLCHDSKRIDFATWIDWAEQHTLLKTAFPVDVLSPTGTFDVQWGNVQRATHRNTSWDWARFETCAHKWADLSEGNYGVALLNDCKYGYDIHANVIRLSLLKSATDPDPLADLGEHHMVYSLLPHVGDWRTEVAPAAYDLNDPLIVRRIDGSTAKNSANQSQGAFVAVDAPNVIIETIKAAEDGRGFIVRLYENQRYRGKVTLKAGFALAEANHCNLLEVDAESITVQNDSITLDITPYQIISVRLTPR